MFFKSSLALMSIWDNRCIDLKKPQLARLGHSYLQFKDSDLCKFKTSLIYIVAPGQLGLHSLIPSQRKKKWGKEKEEKEITVHSVLNEDFNCLATAQKTRSYVWGDNWWLRCLENQYGFTGILLMFKPRKNTPNWPCTTKDLKCSVSWVR